MSRRFVLLVTLFAVGRLFAQVPAPPAPPIATAPVDHSQEAYVVEKLRTSYRFDNDGTGRRELYARVRIQSESGVEQWGQIIMGYNSANERVDIPFVRVLNPDGSEVTASADAVQDLSIPLEKEAPVYTDYRQKHVTVPGIRPGVELEYDFVTLTHTPLAPGQFWMEHDFAKNGTVLDEQLVLDVPADRKITLKTKPGNDPKISEANGRRIYTWTSSHLDKDEDDKKKDKEKKKLPKGPEFPAVQMTTFASWEQLGSWYRGLEKDRRQPTAEIRAKAAALTQGKTDDLDKVQALYDYVATNFRYISLSFGVGRFQPHAASDVLHNDYGDCKDKHTLLASLLEAAGYQASSVLINSGRKLDPDVPSPSQFDHVFTMLPLGKEEIWMDSTTEVAPFRLLASALRKKQALIIPRNDPPRLEETPADPPMVNRQYSEIQGKVSELGKLDAHVQYEFRGDTELYLRSLFRRIPRNKWTEFVKEMNTYSGLPGEVSDVHATDPAATHEPFRLEYKIAAGNFLDWSKKKSELVLPLSQINMADADEDDPDPVKVGSPVEYVYKLRLEFPAKYTESAPLPFSMKRDYGHYQASYKAEGNVFTAERTLVTTQNQLPSSRASDYIAFRRAVLADAEQHLAVDSSAAGTPMLSADLKGDELYDAAKAAFQRGSFDTAIELLQKVVAAEPKHKSAWMDLGRAYMVMRQTDKAVDAFKKQAELNPYDEFAFSSIGWAYTVERKYDLAAEAFNQAIEINPLSQYAHAALGSMYQESHQYEKAVPELEKAVSLKSDDASLQINLGDAYLNLGQDDKALAAFDRAVQISATPEVWNNIAYQLSLKHAHLDRAQQYAESAVTAIANASRNLSLDRISERDLALISELDANWDTLGWVYFARGDFQKAQKYVRSAWVLGQHAEVGDHLAQIYEKLGEKDEAIRTYAMSLAGIRPTTETRTRLAALVGGDTKVSPVVERHRLELQQSRTLRLGKVAPASGTADFFVLMMSSSAGTKLEAAKFVSGEEKLKPLAENLRTASIDFAFPDEVPAKILRRGTLTCSKDTRECEFVMMLPEDVHSVD
jgi:tetratricopeptide (TPR) repeat protein/transglutaminase-like putative cysteine protease